MFTFKRTTSAPSTGSYSSDAPKLKPKQAKKTVKKSTLSSSSTGPLSLQDSVRDSHSSATSKSRSKGVSFQPPDTTKSSASNKSRGGIGKLFKKKGQAAPPAPAVVTRFELPEASPNNRSRSNVFFDDASCDMSLYTTISKATVDYRHRPSKQRSSRIDDDAVDDAMSYADIQQQLAQVQSRRMDSSAIVEEEEDDEDHEQDQRAAPSSKYPSKAPPKIITQDPSQQDAYS